jgi:hypothetical protein
VSTPQRTLSPRYDCGKGIREVTQSIPSAEISTSISGSPVATRGAVEAGDEVEAGEFIAFAGNSGLTGGPHLHFGVYQDWPPQEGYDVPVNFRNASGQHDSRCGLTIWRLFEALPAE